MRTMVTEGGEQHPDRPCEREELVRPFFLLFPFCDGSPPPTHASLPCVTLLCRFMPPRRSCRKRPRFGAKDQLARALVHVIKLLLSYLLMLAFMTYNVGVCAAVLVGAFIGFFIFQAEPYVETASDAQSCH